MFPARQRGDGRRRIIEQVAIGVVLDQRDAQALHDGRDLLPASGRHGVRRRIVKRRVQVQQTGTAVLLGALQGVGQHALAIIVDGHRTQPQLACREQEAWVGQRIAQHRVTRPGAGREDGEDGRLRA
ncbi:hypothetical protein D3C71_1735630 [compost metagenome]